MKNEKAEQGGARYEPPRVEDLGTLEALTAARGVGAKEGANARSA